MKNNKIKNLKKYGFEFLSIFIAVVLAFALDNWNDNRKDAHSENKILTEISNGLDKDLTDILINVEGHKKGIEACAYFRNVFLGQETEKDPKLFHYFNLTRDFVSIQNNAGYETLKSKGLELVQNDSLRLKIIGLYEYDYAILKKLEEEYFEMQFQENYFKEINETLAPNFKVDSLGQINGIQTPISLSEGQRNKMLIYLWKIETNRKFVIQYYAEIDKKISDLKSLIKNEIKK